MSRTRLPIVLHLPPEQIYRRYRACRTGVERTHWHLIWLLTRPEQPLAPAQAAATVGLTAVWARALLKRWNTEGPAGRGRPPQGGMRRPVQADRRPADRPLGRPAATAARRRPLDRPEG